MCEIKDMTMTLNTKIINNKPWHQNKSPPQILELFPMFSGHRCVRQPCEGLVADL